MKATICLLGRGVEVYIVSPLWDRFLAACCCVFRVLILHQNYLLEFEDITIGSNASF